MKDSKLSILTKGIIKENPVLVLVLGTCPTLAVTTQASNAIGMGIAFTFVLICSNIVISLLRKIIPDKVRIPCYITVIAGFVTIIELVMEAYAYSLYEALGIYLSLIVVNCIILGRAEMFANKNGPFASLLDAIGMGIGFTLTLFVMASIREILGSGTWFGMEIPVLAENNISLMTMAPGGFFVFACLMALVNKITKGRNKRITEYGEEGCEGCPAAAACGAGGDASACAGCTAGGAAKAAEAQKTEAAAAPAKEAEKGGEDK